MNNNFIQIRGAKVHNLKNIDLDIPRDKFVVFTGLSGSGKSSLAFDTLFADGQRRYMESLSSYARQFLGQMEKPNVESINGLSPAISIDQKSASNNPRSTVGTVTEIYDYLRLLYARIGIPHCPICGRKIEQQSIDQIIDKIFELPEGTKISILSPIIRSKKGEHKKELENARKSGYVRVRIDDIIYDLSEDIKLDKNIKHKIEIIVDRLVVKSDIRGRLADSVENALSMANGLCIIDVVDGEKMLFSQNYSCPEHGISIEEIEPRLFSFNNPYGACENCTGLGSLMTVDPNKVIPNRSLSIKQGCIRATGWYYYDGGIATMYYEGLAKHYNFSLDTPFEDLPKKIQDIILYGSNGEIIEMKRETDRESGIYKVAYEGVVINLERRFRETQSQWMKDELGLLMQASDCPKCRGQRLNRVALGVTVGNKNIIELTELSVTEALDYIKEIKLNTKEEAIARPILNEVLSRLNFLNNVGLGYLTLHRSANTLSGGEAQRIRLATQIGSSLMGVLYILDEPSIGLHQRDNGKLINTLKHLRDLGNTVIVVEHDEETILSADHVVDIGPKAGTHGGTVVYNGDVPGLLKCDKSITGQYLSGIKKIEVPKTRRKGNGNKLEVIGAEQNNLKKVNVSIPLGTFTCVSGVSGSGKSSLVNEIINKELSNKLNHAKARAGKFKEIKGIEYLDKVIDITQQPIGRTPRSNPATYTGVFNDIRDLFAQTKDSIMRGYNASRYSFNVKGGRCEACQGDGIVKIEMNFLPDVYVKCDVCHGKRYNHETLEVKYKGKSIYDVLDMTVEEGLEFFSSIPKIKSKLQTLNDVGLGYIKLGQSSTTLSGGEAQRIKLATELSRPQTGKTLYILDEPTTGLHTYDVHILIKVLQKLVDSGNTVLVIEHNLDVIKVADYIIDLGPEGGSLGGKVVATGTPEEVSKNEKSFTGQYLRKVLTK